MTLLPRISLIAKLAASLAVLALCAAQPAVAGGKGKHGLKKKFAALEKKGLLIEVKVNPSEKFDEVQLEMEASSMPALVQVAKKPKPKLPDPRDVVKVVKHHIKEVKHCYNKQVSKMEYADEELVMELTIKTNGRLKAIDVDPEEFEDGPFGKCMAKWTKKWRFPRFTGEVDEGIFQDNISMALPLRFSVTRR